MRRIATVFVAIAVWTSLTAAGGARYRLEDRRSIDDSAPSRLQKVLVVALSDDPDVRNRFEDKFVSHLRARGIAALASHTIVKDLTAIGDREAILAAIEKEGVDGAMTVRAVGLRDIKEESWIADWESWVKKGSTVRELIERTLPLPAKKAKRYGLEFALWSTSPGGLLWAARTGTCSRRDLQMGVADLLQLAIDGLKDTRWI